MHFEILNVMHTLNIFPRLHNYFLFSTDNSCINLKTDGLNL